MSTSRPHRSGPENDSGFRCRPHHGSGNIHISGHPTRGVSERIRVGSESVATRRYRVIVRVRSLHRIDDALRSVSEPVSGAPESSASFGHCTRPLIGLLRDRVTTLTVVRYVIGGLGDPFVPALRELLSVPTFIHRARVGGRGVFT